MQLLVLVAVFGLMYVMLIRPQQQRVKAQRALVLSLEVGDEVVTAGGLIGRIVRLDDDTADVETLPGTVLRFRRLAVTGRVPAVTEAETETETSDNGADQ